MFTFHPRSWSQQARDLTDVQVWSINNGWQTIDGTGCYFSTYHRHLLIREHAAKRFGRMIRAGKVHENLEAYYNHYPERKDCE